MLELYHQLSKKELLELNEYLTKEEYRILASPMKGESGVTEKVMITSFSEDNPVLTLQTIH